MIGPATSAQRRPVQLARQRHFGVSRLGHAVPVTTRSELSDISSLLHDEWFHVERLDHNAEQREVRLPIYAGRWKKRWFMETGRPPDEPPPPPTATLVVRNVNEVSVEDDADVGWYGVSHLAYNEESAELRVIANIPCEIVVRTDELDVELLRP